MPWQSHKVNEAKQYYADLLFQNNFIYSLADLSKIKRVCKRLYFTQGAWPCLYLSGGERYGRMNSGNKILPSLTKIPNSKEEICIFVFEAR